MRSPHKLELLVEGRQVGFIAEELADIVPEAAGLDAQGKPYNIAYGKLVPLLVKALQELAATPSRS